jgi:sugar lactone lactonase YvrE
MVRGILLSLDLGTASPEGWRHQENKMKRWTVSVGRRLRMAVVFLAVLALGVASIGPAQAAQIGGIDTFANVPATPGFPEGITVHGNSVFVSGPARFGTAGTGPSAIQVFNRKTGALEQTIYVAGEALAYEHALTNTAVDADGRIYALSTQLGLIRFTRQGQTYVQSSYGAPIPDLLVCAAVSPGVDCAPTSFDMPPIVNDIAFDPQGYAYVTDSLQATIWRYAPGGGAAQIWFQSPLFEGGGFFPFGPNGIRLDNERTYVYIAISTSAMNPLQGTIYRLPLVNQPAQADLQVFHIYTGGELPDQLAFGARGDVYVSLAMSNQISVLAADGTEQARYASAAGDAIPLDNPAGIAFDARAKSLLILNHALLSGDPSHFAVLQMYANDPGAPLVKPALP